MPGYRRVNLVLEQNPDLHALVTQALEAEWSERKVADAYLIVWEVGGVTPYHDHGDAMGVIVGITGDVEELRFDKVTKGQVLHRIMRPGTVCYETPEYIQRMRNIGEVRAVTLHIFFNGPMTMTEYTEEEMRVGR